MNPVLTAFLERADVSRWTGLPAVTPGDLGFDETAPPQWGRRGDPGMPARWFAGPPGCFEEGVRCWLGPSGAVEVVEGSLPSSTDGEPVAAPDLGEPTRRLDAKLDVLTLHGGELVYPDRGLAVRINPDNGLLLGLVGFAPTTAEEYATRVRPVHEIERPLGAGRRSP